MFVPISVTGVASKRSPTAAEGEGLSSSGTAAVTVLLVFSGVGLYKTVVFSARAARPFSCARALDAGSLLLLDSC